MYLAAAGQRMRSGYLAAHCVVAEALQPFQAETARYDWAQGHALVLQGHSHDHSDQAKLQWPWRVAHPHPSAMQVLHDGHVQLKYDRSCRGFARKVPQVPSLLLLQHTLL